MVIAWTQIKVKSLAVKHSSSYKRKFKKQRIPVLVETTVARLIDPGLTLAAAYAIFVLVLLFRPQGLFGRKPT